MYNLDKDEIIILIKSKTPNINSEKHELIERCGSWVGKGEGRFYAWYTNMLNLFTIEELKDMLITLKTQ